MSWKPLLLNGVIFAMIAYIFVFGASAVLFLMFAVSAWFGLVYHRKIWPETPSRKDSLVAGPVALRGCLQPLNTSWLTFEQMNQQAFYIALGSGDEVRVEPQEKLVVSGEHGGDWMKHKPVLLQGSLKMSDDPRAQGDSYRDVGQALVLCPIEGGSLLLSSGEHQEEYIQHRRELWSAAAAWLLMCAVFIPWESVYGEQSSLTPLAVLCHRLLNMGQP